MRNTVKRIAVLLLAGAMLIGLVACALTLEETPGGDATEPATAEVTTAASTTGAKKQPVTLKIVSLNAQNADYDTSEEPTIESKYQKLADAISEKNPDIVFLQECNTSVSAEAIRQRMANKTKYALVSEAGATAMLIYNRDVFTLQGHGSRKIGEENDANGSKYERYLVWAQLQHKDVSTPIVVSPVHVDYVTKACKAQLDMIVQYLKDNFPQVPFILGGDFNAEIGTVSATSLTTEGYLNAGTAATEKINGDEKTFPEKGQIIDFIWYKRGVAYNATATKYEVVMDALPTDHRMIYAEITLSR
ncbi:MAG: endonuclease/exonuclease/phosphatase family protein [Clostridia bacterium]|nr:endonuclease/exonuclease/phosphatase family protein [Clostridia bacterium]